MSDAFEDVLTRTRQIAQCSLQFIATTTVIKPILCTSEIAAASGSVRKNNAQLAAIELSGIEQ
jgi:hypothetical protein